MLCVLGSSKTQHLSLSMLKIIYFELYPHPEAFKRCIFDAFLFNPACAKVPVRTRNSHAQSISPASCRCKRVDDHSRFYATAGTQQGNIYVRCQFQHAKIACQCDLRTLLQHLSDPNQTPCHPERRTPPFYVRTPPPRT